jgi:hypothetical protein
MKIRASGFPQQGLSQLISGLVEQVVLLGSAFDRAGFDAAGMIGELVSGNPFQ